MGRWARPDCDRGPGRLTFDEKLTSPLGTRISRWLHGEIRARTVGFPTSSNRASSFHLGWAGVPPDEEIASVSAVLEVAVAPVVDDLYFWALQASFTDRGRRFGAGHLGLQWHPAHPGSSAVNWGGYDSAGREIGGTTSPLPSATGNPNTRDFAWQARQRYRLTIERGGVDGAWLGSVDGQPVRELDGGGRQLSEITVWTEVFARCDDPSVTVRWSDFVASTADGRRVGPNGLVVSYQQRADGGCDNTSVEVCDGVAEQVTNVERQVRPGTVLPW